MSVGSWGQGGQTEAHSESGLAEVLSAYLAYGGQLGGARRWADSPLTLTHVRWQGPAGQALSAGRRPGDDNMLSTGEREAWVQLAIRYPAVAPAPAGPAAPWVPLQLSRDEAQTLATGIARSRPPLGSPSGGSPWSSPMSAPQTPVRGPGTSYASNGPVSQINQVTGQWARNAQEVVIPCVEVELPPTVNGVAADYAQDYARDVAQHFARAARTIPQVRETRAWMRGDRLVLAAYMTVDTGGRPLSQSDRDYGARMLGAALAQRTLPFARMGFAEMSEWMSGSPLPE
jgi:hypothetical protein